MSYELMLAAVRGEGGAYKEGLGPAEAEYELAGRGENEHTREGVGEG